MWSMSAKEEEVKLAEMEASLRRLVVELVRPAVCKVDRSLAEVAEMKEAMQEFYVTIGKMTENMESVYECTRAVNEIKKRSEELTYRVSTLDSQFHVYSRTMSERVRQAEATLELTGLKTTALDQALISTAQDIDSANNQIKRVTSSLDYQISQTRDTIKSEVKGLRLSSKELEEWLQRVTDELLGPEGIDSNSCEMLAPSIRRLDFQTMNLGITMKSVLSEMEGLRKLDTRFATAEKNQSRVGTQLEVVHALSQKTRDTLERLSCDAKSESQRTANQMAAFMANLTKDLRSGFQNEVKALRRMHGDIKNEIDEGKRVTFNLDTHFGCLTEHVEATLREMRIDLESVEKQIRSEKQAAAEKVQGVQQQVGLIMASTESAVRGLEHISSVISMSLQGHRASVATDLQDFADRKSAAYVGIRQTARSCRAWDARGKPGIDPTTLERMKYEPKPVTFQGVTLDRPQILALRERIIYAAQELMKKGPCSPGSRFPGALVNAAIPAVPVLIGGDTEPPKQHSFKSNPCSQNCGSRDEPTDESREILSGRNHVSTPDAAERDTSDCKNSCSDALQPDNSGGHLPALVTAK